MPRKRRKSKSEDIGGSWMDTYADTITLLLTFFILLYSISAVDSQKLKELSKALQQSLGGSTAVSELNNINDLKVNAGNSNETKEDLLEKVNEAIKGNSLENIIKVREEERGIILQLDETILFDSGKADLKESSIKALDTITKLANSMNNDILVEGHTDNIPIHNSQFASNWELSTERAVSVVRYFVGNKGVAPTRFSVKGYGEFKPLVANTTPENRAINRRVDVLIVDQKDDQKAQDTNDQQTQKEQS